MSLSSQLPDASLDTDGERTMESILRELREIFAKQSRDEHCHPQRIPLSEEIERAIRE